MSTFRVPRRVVLTSGMYKVLFCIYERPCNDVLRSVLCETREQNVQFEDLKKFYQAIATLVYSVEGDPRREEFVDKLYVAEASELFTFSFKTDDGKLKPACVCWNLISE